VWRARERKELRIISKLLAEATEQWELSLVDVRNSEGAVV
jgi:hypothetical protein